jgi:glycerate-2-kinase
VSWLRIASTAARGFRFLSAAEEEKVERVAQGFAARGLGLSILAHRSQLEGLAREVGVQLEELLEVSGCREVRENWYACPLARLEGGELVVNAVLAKLAPIQTGLDRR